MTVLDRSEHLLAEGKRRAVEAGLEINWLHGDMWEIPLGPHFGDVGQTFKGTVNVLSGWSSSHQVGDPRGMSPRSINRHKHHRFPAEVGSEYEWNRKLG
jgi:hypothetical protein